MVLTDDNFAHDRAAVEAGRRVYDNVRKFVLYIFAHATPEVVPFLVFALSGGRVPLPITVHPDPRHRHRHRDPSRARPRTRTSRTRASWTARPDPPASDSSARALLVRAWALLGGVSAVLVIAGFFWVLLAGGWTLGADVGAVEPAAPGLPAGHHHDLPGHRRLPGRHRLRRPDRSRVAVFSIGVFSNRLLLWGIAFELALRRRDRARSRGSTTRWAWPCPLRRSWPCSRSSPWSSGASTRSPAGSSGGATSAGAWRGDRIALLRLRRRGESDQTPSRGLRLPWTRLWTVEWGCHGTSDDRHQAVRPEAASWSGDTPEAQ